MLVLSSPPYNLPMSQDHNGTRGGARGTSPSEKGAFVKYGTSVGQLEGLPMGSLDIVLLSSPPYAESFHGQQEKTLRVELEKRFPRWHTGGRSQIDTPRGYGTTPGQLGTMKGGLLATVSTRNIPIPLIQETVWQGCYSGSWKGLLVEAAWPHPAKYSRTLIQRIYQHLRDQYGLKPGSVILDCFGGVALGGLDALLAGYHWVGVELEPAFMTAGQANITFWRHKFGPQPGSVTLLQGDSRFLRQVLHEAHPAVCLSSPPYATGDSAGPESLGRRTDKSALAMPHCQGWGIGGQNNPGNLAALPPGSLDTALLSSPPYHDALTHGGQVHKTGFQQGQTHGKDALANGYGRSTGQLQNLPGGSLDATLISSPPYGDQQVGTGSESRAGWRGYTDHGGGTAAREGQLSAMPIATGDTFWSAAAQVLTEVAALLPPGALAVWIVKAYVRDGCVVDFPGDWQRLCEATGFRLVERIEASLVEEHGTETTLWGTDVPRRTKRASFFRKLAEKKGAPHIDNEIILIFRRNGGA
jgi:hypothetical protein